MKHNPLVKPFLKWAGGKRYLTPIIKDRFPKPFKGTYFEPFLGGGAVLFFIQPERAIVNDINAELINCYQTIRDFPEELIECLEQHPNEESYYYQIRDWDRSADYKLRSPIERASRIIYLNKTCYNGLFRVNSQGQFNVPFGKYKSPNIADKMVLHAVSRYLNSADITFLNTDYADAVSIAKRGDFCYLDPPYDTETDPASFTGYDLRGFGRDEQERLRTLVTDLDNRKCKFLLSNSATTYTKDIYSWYTIETVEVPRPINSNALKRGKVDEILVRNYEPTRTQKNKK